MMLIQQIRYTLRTLRTAPGFTAMAILTVALGVGANTAVFSVVDAVLLRPLTYERPDQLVSVWEAPRSRPSERYGIAAANLAHYRTARSFEGLAGVTRRSRSLTKSGDPAQLLGEEVSANLFTLLGASAAIGRVFGPEDDRPGRRHVVILTDALWRARFGADPAILGRAILLDDEPYEVIGVMPPGFQALSSVRSGFTTTFFVPDAFDAPLTQGGGRGISVVGRLKPDVSIERARAEVRSLSDALARLAPDATRDVSAAIAPLRDELVRDVRPSLIVMLGAVGLVLLIACVNLANLLIVRAIGQRREVAIRMAVGATRAQITLDLAMRGLILGVLGGAAGLLCGVWTRNLLVAMAPLTMPRLSEIALNPRVLAVTFGLAAITGIVAGLLPALQLWRGDAAPTLRTSALTTSGVRSVTRWRGLLMAAEIAAALTLAVGAGLLVRSLVRLTSVELGFRTDDVLFFTLRPPDTRYGDQVARAALFEEIARRLDAIPGVTSVAIASDFPLRGGFRSRVTISPQMASGDATGGGIAGVQIVSPGYFTTLRIPLRRGRLLTAEDRIGAPPAAVVSETFARRFLPDRDPIGQRFRREPDSPELTVVGVVGEVRKDGPHAAIMPEVYLPAAQAHSYTERLGEVAVRAARHPFALVPAMQRAIWSVDPDQPLGAVLALDEIVSGATTVRRFNMALLSAVAALAFALALVGVYGVVAHAAAQRTREIGIRVALGAGRGHVVALVVASGLHWALIGVIAGLAAAYAGTRFMATLLFGISPTDLPTFAGLAAVMLAVACLASYVPARRAASVNPVSALRAD